MTVEMKSKIIRVTALLLACMALILLGGCKKRYRKDVYAPKFTYTTLDDGTLKITGVDKGGYQTSALKIPAHIDGKAVTVIGRRAFEEEVDNDLHRNLDTTHSTILLPEGLRKIETKAFYECSVESLYIPDSVQVIEEAAFSFCENLREISVSKNTQFDGKDAYDFPVTITYR